MSIKYITKRVEDQKWCVKTAKAGKPIGIFEKRKSAIDFAKSLKSTTGILIQSQDGKFIKIYPLESGEKIKKSDISVSNKSKRQLIQEAKKNHKELISNKKSNKSNNKNKIEKPKKEKVLVGNPGIIKDSKLLQKEVYDLENLLNEQTDIKKALKKSSSKYKKALIIFEILILLGIIATGILFALNWKGIIDLKLNSIKN